ncbi:MAG TPA: hypothetical protein VGO67_01545 [Verrucomicrobiae bacterium]
MKFPLVSWNDSVALGSATVPVASVGVSPTDNPGTTQFCKMPDKSVWRDDRAPGFFTLPAGRLFVV